MKQVTKQIIRDVSNISNVLDAMKKLLADIESNNQTLLLVSHGLCSNIECYVERQIKLNGIMWHWPNRSENFSYPIKSGSAYLSPKCMYQIKSLSNLYVGAYGKRRINLLKWLIKEFELALKILKGV